MFKGSLVALVTPMQADLSIDWAALQNLVEWHIDQGTSGIVAVGTTGESATLDVNEHVAVIQKVVDQVNGRVPVIAGTGANSTSEALELTEAAKSVNADGCLLVTPYYNKPTQEGLFLHHEYIAKRVSIPQLLYNVPGRTAVDMLPETVGRLAKIENIIGIKEATGSIDRLKDIIGVVDDDFALLSGDDESAREFMLAGGHGAISVTANVAPGHVAQLCELAQSGDAAAAQEVDNVIIELHKTLFLESNPIPVKWAVAQLGLIQPHIRLPMTQLSEEFKSPVLQAMQKAGVI